MRLLRLLTPLLILAALVPFGGTLHAQDDNPNPEIVICADEAGCFHSDKSGELTTEQLTTLLGENETGGETVVCTPSEGCQWAAPDADELDIVFGGDGEADGEKGTPPEVTKETEALFPPTEVDTPMISPVEGTWTAYHLAGVMDCGVMALDIPASEAESGELIVEDDGERLTAVSPDPELETVPMLRVGDGVYHATIELEADGGTMTLNFDEVFIANTMAIGVIHGNIQQQGVECTIRRPFYTTVEGLELLDAPVSDDTSSD